MRFYIKLGWVVSKDKEQTLIELRAKRQVLADYLVSRKTDKDKATRKLQLINKDMKETVEKIKNISYAIGQINGEYNRAKDMSGKVSDHAIVRYLERYKGINMMDVVTEILEHPDRKYSGDMVVSIYKEDEDLTTDKSVKDQLRIIKFREKKNG